MKHIIKLPAVILGLLLLVTGLTQNAMAQDEDDISLETFYEELAPYGRWTQDPEYGYVWQPDVDRNFRPYYTDGHWTMTEYGNTWVSDYEWGWAPFHYGRWVTNRFDQWIWIPDTEWGPAWVSWRSGEGYYGWAPLSPQYNDFSGYGGYDAPLSWWAFIPQINIYSNNYPVYYNRGQAFYNRTAFISYTYRGGGRPFYTGPRVDDIRRVTRRDVTVYRVNTARRPGRYSITNNNINIYRPRVTGGRGSSNPAPVNSGRPDNAGGSRPGRGHTPSNGQSAQPSRNNQGRDNNTNPGQPAVNDAWRGNSGRGGRGSNVSPAQPGTTNPAAVRPEAYTPRTGNDQGQRPQRSRRDGIDRPEQMQQQMQRDGQQRAQQDQQQRQQQRDAQRAQQDQQRAQQDQQQRAQQEQQRQQQMQQMQQQRAQQDQQRQQMQQQRQQQDQQRQQQDQQQRQQRAQQEQQQRQQQQQQQQQARPAEQGRGGRGGRGN